MEALVAQVSQLQACGQQHSVLELGFVLGLARVRGQRRHVVVRGQVVVGEVDVGFVARGIRNTAEQVSRCRCGAVHV